MSRMEIEDLTYADSDLIEGTTEVFGRTFEVYAVRILRDEVGGSFDVDPDSEAALQEFEAFNAYLDARGSSAAPEPIEIPGFDGEWLLWIVPGFSP